MDGSLKFIYASRASHYLDSAQRDRANKCQNSKMVFMRVIIGAHGND